MANEQPSIPVGYVRRPHGIGGDVVVRGLVTDAGDRFVEGATLRTGEDEPRSFEVAAVKIHKGDFLVRLTGVGDRNAAEQLVGVQFHISLDERRDLEESEWWAEELVGCAVVDLTGGSVGTVSDVVTGAAQDRLVVQPDNGDPFDVPFVDEIVPTVNVEQGTITVDLPEGLSG